MNCALCKSARIMMSGNIRCVIAHQTINDVNVLCGQKLTSLLVSAPLWCPKKIIMEK